MKPIKLSLTAFGPYKDTETIDFTQLEQHRIFVISGQTGAGKTTIFDAVCYALYGTASGEDRAEFRTLRSHFADEQVHTSVELLFSVKDKRYRVFRQMKHRKGNNKSETGDKIELYEYTADGEEIPAVDRFVVQDVNQRLVQIIGLTKDQFSQIVMLPQGEFRKLLTSSTDNKEEVLRKIFRTEKFERLEQLVGQKYKQKLEQVKEQLAEQQSLFTQAKELFAAPRSSKLEQLCLQPQFNSNQLVEALAEEKLALQGLTMHVEEEKKLTQQKLTQSRNRLAEKEQLNEKIKRHELLKANLAQQLLMQDEYKLWKDKLQAAGRAAEVAWVDKARIEAQQRLVQAQQQLTKQQDQLAIVKQLLLEAKHRLAYEEQHADERKQLALAIHELEQLMPLIKEHKQLEEQVKQGEASLKLERQQLAKQTEQQLLVKEKLKEVKLVIQQHDHAKVELVQLAKQKEETLRQGKLVSKIIELNEQYSELQVKEQYMIKEYTRLQTHYSKLELSWINAQAAILATHLHAGEACPVCGAVEHPQKAVLNEQAPTKQQIDEARGEADVFQKQQMELQAKLMTIKSQLNSYADELKDDELARCLAHYTGNDDSLAHQLLALQQQLRMVWKEQQATHDSLSQSTQIAEQAKVQLEQLEAQYELLELQLSKQTTLVEKLNIDFTAAQVKLGAVKARLPEAMSNSEQLEIQYNEQKNKLAQLEQAFKQAEEQLQNYDKQCSALQSTIVYAQQTVDELQQAYIAAQQAYSQKLEQLQFASDEHYVQAKLEQHEIDQLQQRIQVYEHDLLTLQHELQQLEAAIDDFTMTNTDELKAELNQLESLYEGLLKEEAALHQLIRQLDGLVHKLVTLAAHMHTIEQEIAMIHDLFLTIKGDNRLKLSYERYVLIDYLEQIIVMANQRLKLLTNGQFELKRSDRLEANGKQSGLGLDVYDSFTGQNRDVKSLSGGEKFNASLCLALGMTDVIQASQGGISIEMMFIDEGFGSLDEESLHKAIATLVDLQRAGRMIGVISHVQELKDALDACLEVTKTRDGHARAAFILKK